MSDIWLKTSTVFLLVLWIVILVRMKTVSKFQFIEPRHIEVPSNDIIATDLELSKDISVEAEAHSFERWKELLSNGEEACSTIIESRLWDGQQYAYKQFKMLCKEKRISIIRKDELGRISNRTIVHFDDPAIMPFLWEKGYHIKLVKGKSFVDLLKSVFPFSLIILSIKDEGSQALNHKWQEELDQLGVCSLTREHLRHSYINVIWKKSEEAYVSIYEELSMDPVSRHFKPNEKIKDFFISMDLEVSSAGLTCGNYSSIKIDGQEYSPNLRGMNIVIYDLIDSRVEAVHRVDSFVSIYEDTTIYRAQPEAEHNAI
jgi:hypothetical protein